MSTYIYQMRCCQDIVDSKMGMILAFNKYIALYIVTLLQFTGILENQMIN